MFDYVVLSDSTKAIYKKLFNGISHIGVKDFGKLLIKNLIDASVGLSSKFLPD